MNAGNPTRGPRRGRSQARDGLRAALAALAVAVSPVATGVCPAAVTAEPASPGPPHATAPAAPPVENSAASRTIELHKGIPGVVYLGQPLADLLAAFPGSDVAPFAGQSNVATVRIPREGISCQVAGPGAADLRVVSVGFNLSGRYESFAEGTFHTDKGIRKGSTVNDVLEAYGPPARIERPKRPARAPQGAPAPDLPPVSESYIFTAPDGKVATYFVIEEALVRRIVINDLEPIRRYLIEGRTTG